MTSKTVYLASGFFNPKQLSQVERLENLLSSFSWINLKSPRKIFVCPPDADLATQEATFKGNMSHIESADFIVCNTEAKDIGSIFECGAAYALSKPIIYFCEGLTGNFNLMLAKSGVKVTTSIEQLQVYLDAVDKAGAPYNLPFQPYTATIE